MTEPRTVVGGRYEIIRKIAEGGMGSVHEAMHLLSRRVVALKLLAPEVARDETKRQRFLREVSAPAQIGHDGIVEVFDAGYDDKLGLLFVAMELLQGETLRERIARLDPKRNPAARETLLDIFDRMLEPIAAAHARGIVHRDLKPENVFIQRRRDGNEVVKILDFGIARELDTSAPSVTQTGVAMGTPHYMSPEQAMNAREASFPADVWSLGAMLYEILSGETPFPGEAAGSIIAAAVTEAHRPVGAVAPGTSSELSDLVDRCLAKRPEGRPRDARAMLDELRRARGRAAPAMAFGATPAPSSSGSAVPHAPATGPMTGHMGPAQTGPAHTGPAQTGPVGVSPLAATGAIPSPLSSSSTPMPPTLGASAHTGPMPEAPRGSSPSSGFGTPTHTPPIAPPSAAHAAPQSEGSRTWLWVTLAAVLTLFGGGTCCIASIFGLGILGTSGGGGGGGGVASLARGPVDWTGELTTVDRMEGARYYDTYSFEAPPGRSFTVTLTSPDFDTILRVGTPSGQAFENDDFVGMGLDSRIDVRSAESGTYTVHVTSYSEYATGQYSVNVR